jgi:hypothetical protein
MVKEIDNMVRFSEIILDVVIFGRDAELDELVLERPCLFKKAMYFAVDFHLFFLVSFSNPYPQLWPCGWRRGVLPVFVGISLSSYFYAA